jgi:alpha-N-arabinofuranosidase
MCGAASEATNACISPSTSGTSGTVRARPSIRAAPPLLEEVYNLEDALVCAQYLTAFLRRADLVKIACLAQLVNVIAPVMTRADGLWLQTIYHPFAMISELGRGLSLIPRIKGPSLVAGARGEVPVLDAAAAFEPETGELAVFLINRSRREDLSVEVRLDDRELAREASCTVLGGGDLKAENSFGEPDRVRPRAGRVTRTERGLSVQVPAPGLSVLRAKTIAR